MSCSCFAITASSCKPGVSNIGPIIHPYLPHLHPISSFRPSRERREHSAAATEQLSQSSKRRISGLFGVAQVMIAEALMPHEPYRSCSCHQNKANQYLAALSQFLTSFAKACQGLERSISQLLNVRKASAIADCDLLV
jgi:hypothetical protein